MATILASESRVRAFIADPAALPTCVDVIEAVTTLPDGSLCLRLANGQRLRACVRVHHDGVEATALPMPEVTSATTPASELHSSHPRLQLRATLRRAPGERGMEVRLEVDSSPCGPTSDVADSEVRARLRVSLGKLKMLLECGELATSARELPEAPSSAVRNVAANARKAAVVVAALGTQDGLGKVAP